jgi:uncharacterized paraquat-inducible protein A
MSRSFSVELGLSPSEAYALYDLLRYATNHRERDAEAERFHTIRTRLGKQVERIVCPGCNERAIKKGGRCNRCYLKEWRAESA